MMIELAPEIEKTVREPARPEGLSESDYIARLVQNVGPQPKAVTPPSPAPNVSTWHKFTDTSDDEKRAKVLEYIGLSKKEAIRRNAPSIARFQAKLDEAAKASPEEIAQAEAEWEAFKEAMNASRRLTGERLFFPELAEPDENPQP